jgi:cytochrome c556
MRRFVASTLIIAALAVPVLADVGTDREDTMKSIGGAIKALSGIVKGTDAFDPAMVAANSDKIVTGLQKFGTLFDPGTEQASKKASPDIWTNRAEFDAARENAIKAAQALTASNADNFKAAFLALGQSCKGCHEKFRLAD